MMAINLEKASNSFSAVGQSWKMALHVVANDPPHFIPHFFAVACVHVLLLVGEVPIYCLHPATVFMFADVPYQQGLHYGHIALLIGQQYEKNKPYHHPHAFRHRGSHWLGKRSNVLICVHVFHQLVSPIEEVLRHQVVPEVVLLDYTDDGIIIV